MGITVSPTLGVASLFSCSLVPFTEVIDKFLTYKGLVCHFHGGESMVQAYMGLEQQLRSVHVLSTSCRQKELNCFLFGDCFPNVAQAGLKLRVLLPCLSKCLSCSHVPLKYVCRGQLLREQFSPTFMWAAGV